MEITKQTIRGKILQAVWLSDFLTLDPYWQGFAADADAMDDPNPAGCKQPKIQIFKFEERCRTGNVFGSLGHLAKAIVTEGTPPYQYFWDFNAVASANDKAQLSDGQHHLKVVDANLRVAYASFTLDPPPVPELYVRVKHYCSTDAVPAGKLFFEQDRNVFIYDTGSDLGGYWTEQPAIPANRTVRIRDAANALLYNGRVENIDSVNLAVGVYTLSVEDGCERTFVFKICDRCDQTGTFERLPLQPCNCEDCN